MDQILYDLLEAYGYPVFKQGSLGDDDYPERFFTYWGSDSSDGHHYDNKSISVIYEYEVNYYSTDPADTFDTLHKMIELLKERGFIISGDGHDVLSDELTHTGRGVHVTYTNYK